MVTAIYAGLLGCLLLVLAFLITRLRRLHLIGVGDGGREDLKLLLRAQGNFVEYVPTCLILLYLAETASYPSWLLHGVGAMLVLGRLLHAYGISHSAGKSFGRFFGTVFTWAVLATLSVAAIASGVDNFISAS